LTRYSRSVVLKRTTCRAPVTAPGEARVTGLRRETSGEAAFAAPLVRSEASRGAAHARSTGVSGENASTRNSCTGFTKCLRRNSISLFNIFSITDKNPVKWVKEGKGFPVHENKEVKVNAFF